MKNFYNVTTNKRNMLYGYDIYKTFYPNHQYIETPCSYEAQPTVKNGEVLFDYCAERSEDIYKKYQDKVNIYNLFPDTMPDSLLSTRATFRADLQTMLNKYGKVYVTQRYNEGAGTNSAVITADDTGKTAQMYDYLSQSDSNAVRISEFKNITAAPCVYIVIFKDGYIPLKPSLQHISNAISLSGFAYPADFENSAIVKRVAEHFMANERDFRGIVAVDTMIDTDGNMFMAEVDTKKQGGLGFHNLWYKHNATIPITKLERRARRNASVNDVNLEYLSSCSYDVQYKEITELDSSCLEEDYKVVYQRICEAYESRTDLRLCFSDKLDVSGDDGKICKKDIAIFFDLRF